MIWRRPILEWRGRHSLVGVTWFLTITTVRSQREEEADPQYAFFYFFFFLSFSSVLQHTFPSLFSDAMTKTITKSDLGENEFI